MERMYIRKTVYLLKWVVFLRFKEISYRIGSAWIIHESRLLKSQGVRDAAAALHILYED